jgi:hypothetical protein
MLRRRRNLRSAHRSIGRERALNCEGLEGRIVLAAGIAHDRASRVLEKRRIFKNVQAKAHDKSIR